MRISTSLDCLGPGERIALTIGAFDGLHIGHQHLIRQLVQHAHQRGLLAAALTFEPHPRKVLMPERKLTLLSSVHERDAVFNALGLDLLLLLPFTRELAATGAREFVRHLAGCLHMAELWVGEDFALGRDRGGDRRALAELASELGYRLHVVPPLMLGGEPVSSTRIRALIEAGRMPEAAELLGREYCVNSVVVPGAQRGRRHPAEHGRAADHRAGRPRHGRTPGRRRNVGRGRGAGQRGRGAGLQSAAAAGGGAREARAAPGPGAGLLLRVHAPAGRGAGASAAGAP